MPVAAASVIHLAWNCLINTRPKLKTWPLNPVPFPRKKHQTFSGLYLNVFFERIMNGILLPKLFWPTVRENCSSDWEKLLKFKAGGWEFAKILRSHRTICLNSERSEQFLVTECFFWSNRLEQLEFKLEKKYWDLETCKKI